MGNLSPEEAEEFGRRAAEAYRELVALGFFAKGGIKYVTSTIKKALPAAKPPGAALPPAGALDWSNTSRKGENALSHVNRHATPNPQRANHGVFNGDPQTMVEQAWSRRGSVTPISDGMGGSIYNIPHWNAGFQSGYVNFGQKMNYITIVVKDGTSTVLTAFP